MLEFCECLEAIARSLDDEHRVSLNIYPDGSGGICVEGGRGERFKGARGLIGDDYAWANRGEMDYQVGRFLQENAVSLD